MNKSKISQAKSENGNGKKRENFPIVAIGASAGGIQALKEFFENVPVGTGMAYVVILHLSPDHESRLAEVLQTVAQIPVTQIKERVKVEPNHVYVVPPNQHLGMSDGHITVEQNVNVEERRAPIDIFFRTLAESHQARAISVILSGTGADGSMETFHFGLNPGAFLFLGISESTDGASDLFVNVSKEHHVYQSRQAMAKIPYPVPDVPKPMRYVEPEIPAITTQEQENRLLEHISFSDLHQQMLEQYAPTSIVVNENYDIMHLSEHAGRFLQIAGGEPSKNLLHLIRPELRLELRAALFQAVQRRANVAADDVKMQTDGQVEIISIQVRPVLRPEDTARGFLLVLFDTSQNKDGDAAEKIITSDEPLARRLEAELERTKTQLRTSIEQYEIQTEELRASNEELQAINEELQSVNEQSMTVNQELKIKIEELSTSNNDFKNLLNSTDIGTIFLDRSLRVKMFTPPAREVFNLIDADLNRPLADITTKINFDDLRRDVEKVLDTLQTTEREFATDKGKWYLMRVYPYRTREDKINGVVVTFIEITTRIKSEQALRNLAQSREQQTRVFDTALSSIADFAYTFDNAGRFTYANRPLLDLLGITIEEITGKTFHDLPYPKELADKLHSQILHVIETRKPVTDETPFVNPAGEDGYYEYIFAPVIGEDGTVEVVAGSTRVITERRRAEEKLRESAEFNSTVLSSLNAQIAVLDSGGNITIVNEAWRRFARENGGEKALERTGVGVDYLQVCRRAAGDSVDDALKTLAGIESVLQGKTPFFSLEYPCHANNVQRWFLLNVKPLHGGRGGAVVSHLDISERRRAEHSLSKSEERLRLLVESANDYAIFTITKDNIVDSWNTGAENTFGWKENEMIGKSAAILFTPEDQERGVPAMEIQCAAETGKAEDERWHIRKDGSRFYASGVMQPLRDGGVHGFVKICRDQTEKIEAEKALHDKEVLQKLVGAQEDERKRIARDLHDELGQKLTALRFKLEAVRKICEETEVCGKIDELQVIAQHIDADVDFLAWELRPAALDDLGLYAALTNYVNEWSRHSGVTAEFHVVGMKNKRLLSEVETNLYRITQEALNNTHKHARAKRVNVMLEKREHSIVLIIEDDGKGFNPEDKINRSKGLGLVGIKERAALVGGTTEVESATGEGTTIFVRIPIEKTEKSKTRSKKPHK